MSWSILSGDCLERLADLDDDSIDAVVTDPPYGISFMGKEWDGPAGMLGQMATGKEQRGALAYGGTHSRGYADNDNRAFQVWTEAWATEILRVLKPGGHLLAFGGTRTYHRLASGIEDAGFEIRDCLAWHYGSGFPKSLDVSKAIDKAAGAGREVVGESADSANRTAVSFQTHEAPTGYNASSEGARLITAPATDLARQWQGWGTALKPAFEPIILARKPLIGTVAENVTRFGTGALNVDGCRVEHDGTGQWGTVNKGDTRTIYGSFGDEDGETPGSTRHPSGRWPANLVLDDQAAAMLDEQSGETKSVRSAGRNGSDEAAATFGLNRTDDLPRGHDDTGGASRFFYQAKASRAERNAGLDGFEERPHRRYGEQGQGPLPQQTPRREQVAANVHPTVKPIDLMRWLVRLVTPPGGTVLDPFTGSGTTGIAAGLEGFDFVGIEREAEYQEIAEARLKWWAEQEGETAEILHRAGLAEKERERAERVGQASLFDAEAA